MSSEINFHPLALEQSDAKDLRPWLKWSAASHIVVILILFFLPTSWLGESEPYIPSLRVDIVDLPDALSTETDSTPQAAEAPKEETKEVVEEVPAEAPMALPDTPKPKAKEHPPKETKPEPTEDRKAKLEKALARMKSLSKISESEQPSKPQLIKGNQLSAGSSTSPNAREGGTSAYLDSVLERVRSHWALPVFIARQNLSAQVRIFLDKKGRVRDLKFQKLSGNSQFDQAVRQAILDSEPFGVPPDDIQDQLLSRGVLFGFPL